MPIGYVYTTMSDDDAQTTRRKIMAAAAGALGVGFLAGNASADDGSASGQIGSAAEPALSVYCDTFTFHERSSVPSNPDDGTEVYVPSA